MKYFGNQLLEIMVFSENKNVIFYQNNISLEGRRKCTKCDGTYESFSNTEICYKYIEIINFIEGSKINTICQISSIIIKDEYVICKTKGYTVCKKGESEKNRICDDKLVLFGNQYYFDCPSGSYKENGK